MPSKNDLPQNEDNSSSKSQPEGFFQKIISMFMGMGSSDAEKKRLLRQLSKDLTHARYRFYKPKTCEAQIPLAKFFYEVYKAIAPAQVTLNNASTSGVLKSFVIESFLSKEQRELADHLTDAYINEKANSMAVKDLQEMIKSDMISFFAAFDAEKTIQIDTAYNTILSFINFINFDFFFLLKKFDSNITERSFTYNPRFDVISSDYIADDIADFLEVFQGLNLDADWKRIFEALKQYRNMDVIQIDTWLKLVPAIKDVRASGILENIVRHEKQDPYMDFNARITGERIVEPFIDKLKNQTTLLVQKISQERRTGKIDELANAVFGTNIVLRLKNYTEKSNMVYAKKMLGGFTQTASMNYLKAYLIDYFKKDIRELVDLLIIRGQWSTNVQSQQLSDGYHALLEVSEQIIKFDDELADDGDMGARLRSALMKTDRDKEQLKYVRQLLKDVNEKAVGLVNKAATNLIGIGRHLRSMIEDLSKPHHEMILNWKEIEGVANKPMKEFITDIYKKIYYMVQLLQYYVKEDHE